MRAQLYMMSWYGRWSKKGEMQTGQAVPKEREDRERREASAA
jgi:hypothetical protein